MIKTIIENIRYFISNFILDPKGTITSAKLGRGKTYYDNCEKIGYLRGKAHERFMEVVKYTTLLRNEKDSILCEEYRKLLKEALAKYHIENNKVEKAEFRLGI